MAWITVFTREYGLKYVLNQSVYWVRIKRIVSSGLEVSLVGYLFFSVPGMAWVQLEINQPQVVTAKCSEPQAVDSDVMGEGSGVAILSSVRRETWWG